MSSVPSSRSTKEKKCELSQENDRVGNPLCESCETDRKNVAKNLKKLQNDPCYELIQILADCSRRNPRSVNACFNQWRVLSKCKKDAMWKERGIRPRKLPRGWAAKHPVF